MAGVLIDGIVVVSEPAVLYQQVCGWFFRTLADWTDAPHGRGVVSLPLNVVLDEGNVLAPDVLWFDDELPLDAVNAPRCRIWWSRSVARDVALRHGEPHPALPPKQRGQWIRRCARARCRRDARVSAPAGPLGPRRRSAARRRLTSRRFRSG
jgi:hypothetical protein